MKTIFWTLVTSSHSWLSNWFLKSYWRQPFWNRYVSKGGFIHTIKAQGRFWWRLIIRHSPEALKQIIIFRILRVNCQVTGWTLPVWVWLAVSCSVQRVCCLHQFYGFITKWRGSLKKYKPIVDNENKSILPPVLDLWLIAFNFSLLLQRKVHLAAFWQKNASAGNLIKGFALTIEAWEKSNAAHGSQLLTSRQ